MLSPKLKKRKVSCDSEISAICQVERPCETLRKGKESSVDKAIRASEQRRDEKVRAKFVNYDADTGVHWHSNSYISYTSEQNIRHTTRSDPLKQASRQDEMAPSEVGHFSQGWPQWIGLSV